MRRAGLVAAVVVLLAGSAAAFAGPLDPGAELWVARFNGAANLADTATATVASPDGSKIFVTGDSFFGSKKAQFATLAYDATTGDQLWEADEPGTGDGLDAVDIAVAPDGSKVFVTGGYRFRSALTAAYDATTGSRLWTVTSSVLVFALGIAVSGDGSTVAVTGDNQTAELMSTEAYDAKDGSLLWDAYLSSGQVGSTTGVAITATGDGQQFLATGWGYNGNTYEYLTEAIAVATGKKAWSARYNSPDFGQDFAQAIAASPDGSRVFVSGCSGGGGCGFGSSYGTVAYDVATGRKLWIRTFNGGAHSAEPSAIHVSPDGLKVFVTGTSGGSNGENYGTIAYDAATGTPLWDAIYDGPSADRDYANALGVSPGGATVYVTGGSVSVTAQDYATIAYDALTGAQVWLERYDGPNNGSDFATALAVGSDGTVYVTGQSSGVGTFSDYATVAYSG